MGGARGSGTGLSTRKDGYVVVTRRGPDRGKLQHRMVMAEMCREWCYWPLGEGGIPEGFDVHHQDMQRGHNCRSNLVLLDHLLHQHMDRNGRSNRDRMADGKYGVQPVAPVGSQAVYMELEPCQDCGRVVRLLVSWFYPEELADMPDWVTEDLPEIPEGESLQGEVCG